MAEDMTGVSESWKAHQWEREKKQKKQTERFCRWWDRMNLSNMRYSSLWHVGAEGLLATNVQFLMGLCSQFQSYNLKFQKMNGWNRSFIHVVWAQDYVHIWLLDIQPESS